jgi:hypothetical protein
MEITNTVPSYLLAWFVLCLVAVVGFALQCIWILALQPLFRWLGNR